MNVNERIWKIWTFVGTFRNEIFFRTFLNVRKKLMWRILLIDLKIYKKNIKKNKKMIIVSKLIEEKYIIEKKFSFFYKEYFFSKKRYFSPGKDFAFYYI